MVQRRRSHLNHGAVETNNGAEALNVLKYKYLPRRKHMMLSDIMTTIIEEFLPALHHNTSIRILNSETCIGPTTLLLFQLPTRASQGYNTFCLHRQAKSNAFTERDVCSLEEEGKFTVRGTSTTDTTDFGVCLGSALAKIGSAQNNASISLRVQASPKCLGNVSHQNT